MFLVAANTRQAIVGQKEWITTGSTMDWKVWATLKSVKRPCMVTLAKCQATNFCEINTNGQIQFSLKESANYNYRISATFLLA